MNYNWIPIIPLIGGFPLGAEKAFKKPPEFVASYFGFKSNDDHYLNYQNNVLNRNIEYRLLDNDRKKQKINLVVGTPPCAALSSLNSGISPESSGSTCKKNDWMYRIFEDAIELFSSDVIMIENAPALFTKKGLPVANNLFEICKINGYSLTLYRTSTIHHGLPQARNRAFAIGWKSKTSPIMNYFDIKSEKTFEDLVFDVNSNDIQQDVYVNDRLIEKDPYYWFIKKTTNRDPRDLIHESGEVTSLRYVVKEGLIDKAMETFKEFNYEDGIKKVNHYLYKKSIGGNVWDSSVHVFKDNIKALVGRNLSCTIHPKYDRSLSVRELLNLMGFPKEFELLKNKINHIAQNVPVNTAKCIVNEGVKFLSNELKISNCNYVRQNNLKKTLIYDEIGEIFNGKLDGLFTECS